jgi:hypothetical protein
MVSKNKVKKDAFTELYLVSKKTYNIIKKQKTKIKHEISEEIKNHVYPTYIQSFQTLPHAVNNYRVNNSNVEDPSDDESSGVGDSQITEEIMNNVLNENILNNENVDTEVNHSNDEHIPMNIESEDVINLSNEVENPNIEHMEIHSNMNEDRNLHARESIPEIIQNFNSRNANIDLLNQSRRAQYLNRKKNNLTDIDLINSRLRNDSQRNQTKYREDVLRFHRENINNVNRNAIELGNSDEYIIQHQLPQIQTPQIQMDNHRTPSRILLNIPNSVQTISDSVIDRNTFPPLHMRDINNSYQTPQLQIENNQVLPRIHMNIPNNNNIIQSNTVSDINHITNQPLQAGNVNNSNVVQSENINLNRSISRKRVKPTSTDIVQNTGVVGGITINRNENTASVNHSKNIRINNDFFKKYTGNSDPRTKVHKKAKVIIIEKPDEEKPKNSELVDRILQSNVNDPYDVLQISKTAKLTYSGLKRKFNALSKKLHPDKEPSPGAHEAFIIMRRAFIELKKELQINDEMNKSKTRTNSNTQRGYGIKKWMKLFK